jgi:hypothetical protein
MAPFFLRLHILLLRVSFVLLAAFSGQVNSFVNNNNNNNYGTVKGNVLYYNRISKAGSSTMLALAAKLARRNHFHFVNAPGSRYHQPDILEVRRMLALPRPSFYANHHAIIPLSSPLLKGRPKPININMMREPIARYRSAYDYGIDAKSRSQSSAHKAVERRKRQGVCGCAGLDFNVCALRAPTQCPRNTQLFTLAGQRTFKFLLNSTEIKYFLGNGSSRCSREKQMFAYTKAKEHIDHDYTFVGISEEFELSVKYLEKVLPQFFSGASKLYAQLPRERVTSHASDELTEHIKQIFSTDPCNWANLEIYKYTTQQFHKKVNGLLIFPHSNRRGR